MTAPARAAVAAPPRAVRVAVLLALLGLGCAAWWLGARHAPPLGTPARLAWVPFVVSAWLTLRWRRARGR